MSLIVSGFVSSARGPHGFAQEDTAVDAQSVEAALRKAIARRDRLAKQLSQLKTASGRDDERQGIPSCREELVAPPIRQLEYDLQSARADVASLELMRAEAIIRIYRGAISRYEMTRLKCRDQLERLLLQKMRLVSDMKCAHACNRLAEIELIIAEQQFRVAKNNLDETSRFPRGTISEDEYHRLRDEAREAKLRLEGLRSARQKSDQ
jgi:hypothetical protein